MLGERGPAEDKKHTCFPALVVLNTPNVMLCHKERARHADTSRFGCLAGGGGELELKIPPKHENMIYSHFHVQVVQVVQFKGRGGRDSV